MPKFSRKKRRRLHELFELASKRPSAATVWVALCDMAEQRGSRVVTPTREQLHTLTGLNEKTISSALTALEVAGWIDRSHKPVTTSGKRTATLLRIVLVRTTPSPGHTKRRAKGHRKAPLSPATNQKSVDAETSDSRNGCSAPFTATRPVEGVERPKGNGRSTPLDFPTERSGATTPPPPLCSGEAVTAPHESQRLKKRESQHTEPVASWCDSHPESSVESFSDSSLSTHNSSKPLPPDIARVIAKMGSNDFEDCANNPDDGHCIADRALTHTDVEKGGV